MGAIKIVRNFTGWTSAHGVPHIGSARLPLLRIFWIVVVLISLTMFISQMAALITKYLRYEITVQTELKFEESDFPAVTICNMNPFKRTVINEVVGTEINSILKDYHQRVSALPSDVKTQLSEDPLNLNNITDAMSLTETVADMVSFYGALYNLSSVLKEEKLNTSINKIIIPRSELVKNCAYNTKPCILNRDFKARFDSSYGACYTFNHKKDPVLYKSIRAGPLYGLRLLLVTNQSEYLETTQSAGVRVAVHSQGDEPYADAFGYSAAVGFTTSFGLKFIQTTRAPAPYGECEDVPSGISEINYYTGSYSQESCFRSCYQNEITLDCGCMDPRFPAIPEDYIDRLIEIGENHTREGRPPLGNLNFTSIKEGEEDLKFCNREEQIECDSRKKSRGQEYYIRCSDKKICPLPCLESTFGVSVSNALWPSDEYNPPECQTPNPPNWNDQKECVTWFSRNTMLIEVYYERMNFQLLSESPAYGLVNLISDTGGQLGLWMGVSVITVVELISLLVLLCLYWMSHDKKKYLEEYGKDSDEEPETENEDSDFDEGLDKKSLGKTPDTVEKPTPEVAYEE